MNAESMRTFTPSSSEVKVHFAICAKWWENPGNCLYVLSLFLLGTSYLLTLRTYSYITTTITLIVLSTNQLTTKSLSLRHLPLSNTHLATIYLYLTTSSNHYQLLLMELLLATGKRFFKKEHFAVLGKVAAIIQTKNLYSTKRPTKPPAHLIQVLFATSADSYYHLIMTNVILAVCNSNLKWCV